MDASQIALSPFIAWEHGENFTFSACMKKLMECLDGD